MKAKLASTVRQYKAHEKELQEALNALQRSKDEEEKVHAETSNFLHKKTASLAEMLEIWTKKNEVEIAEKEEEVYHCTYVCLTTYIFIYILANNIEYNVCVCVYTGTEDNTTERDGF